MEAFLRLRPKGRIALDQKDHSHRCLGAPGDAQPKNAQNDHIRHVFAVEDYQKDSIRMMLGYFYQPLNLNSEAPLGLV